MPNCFQLSRKSDPDAKPVVLAEIDEEICAAVAEPVHENLWCRGWYNMIGRMLALGKSFDEIEEILKDEGDKCHLIPVVVFLRENYTSSAWAEIGRS